MLRSKKIVITILVIVLALTIFAVPAFAQTTSYVSTTYNTAWRTSSSTSNYYNGDASFYFTGSNVYGTGTVRAKAATYPYDMYTASTTYSFLPTVRTTSNLYCPNYGNFSGQGKENHDNRLYVAGRGW